MAANIDQLYKIDYELSRIDGCLERILHTQFGIEDREWISIIENLETAYAKVRS